jgi:hypothetical protein
VPNPVVAPEPEPAPKPLLAAAPPPKPHAGVAPEPAASHFGDCSSVALTPVVLAIPQAGLIVNAVLLVIPTIFAKVLLIVITSPTFASVVNTVLVPVTVAKPFVVATVPVKASASLFPHSAMVFSFY